MPLYLFITLSTAISLFLVLYLLSRKPFFLLLGFLGASVTTSSLLFFLDMPAFALILMFVHSVFGCLLIVLNLMMQQNNYIEKKGPNLFYELLCYVALFVLASILFRVFLNKQSLGLDQQFLFSMHKVSTKVLGEVLFSHYLLPFFILILIFWAGIMGIAMVHGHKKRKSDRQALKKQMSRSPDTIELKSLRD